MEWFRKVGRALGLACAVVVAASCGGSGGPAHEAVASKAASGPFTGNGFYWNPAEPGTGMFFELQGTTGVLTLYMYDESARAVWYMASGELTGADGTFNFTGTLLRYAGGQAGSSATPRKPTSTVVGPVQVAFGDGTARVFAQNAPSLNMVRFNAPGSGKPATSTQPETGIYWNPAEDGRGYVVEVSNDTAMIGAFHYDDAGNPTWHLVVAPLTGAQASGDFAAYTGGRTLTGPWKAAVPSPITGQFGVAFQQPCQGRFNFPQMAAIDVRRFAFGVQTAGSECRSQPVSGAGTPGAVSGVSLSLKSPSRLEGDALQGGRLKGEFAFDYVGNAAALAGKTLYVRLEDPDVLFEGGASALVETSLSRAGVKLVGNPLPRAGRYQGNLRMSLCMDAACTVPVPGSPFTIPYDFTARVGLTSNVASPVTINFKPSDEYITVPVMLNVPANSRDALRLQSPYAKFEVPGHTVLDANYYGGLWRIPVSAQPQQIEVRVSVSRQHIHYMPEATMKVETAVSGAAMGPTVESTLRVNFVGRLLEELNTNLSPLSPLPGAPPWTTFQGNAAHTGYVPVQLDATRFNRRFIRGGGSAMVSEGGRACRKVGATLECLSEQDGEVVWRAKLGRGNSASPPALSSGKIYQAVDGIYNGFNTANWGLYVANAATGSLIAEYPAGSSSIDSITLAGEVAYLGSSGHGVTAIDTAAGGTRSYVAYLNNGGGTFAATLSGGRLYAMAIGYLLVLPNPWVNQFTAIADPAAVGRFITSWLAGAVAVDGAAAYYAHQAVADNRSLTRFDLASGTASWTIKGEYISDAVPVGDTVYALKQGVFEARASGNGSLRWSIELPNKYDTSGYLIVAGKYAFVGASGTRAIDLETRKEVWFDPAYGALSISENGILYIAGYDQLVAVNLR